MDLAMRAYWEKSPTEVSLNAICDMAGVSKPSLYREFGNDDGLACAALQNYAETVLGRLLAITAGDADFDTKIRQIAHLAAEDPIHDHGCLFVKMRAVRQQMGPKTQSLIAEIEQSALGAFVKVFADARASGQWAGHITDELAARYLQAQASLALDQRARGQRADDILALALSVLHRGLD